MSPFPSWRRLSAVIVGDDLFVAEVSASLRGLRAGEPVRIERALDRPPGDWAAALAPFTDQRAALLLTCPASWCACRPLEMGVREWARSREALLRSLDQLVPLTPGDALAGVVECAPEGGDSATATLIAIRRSRAQPWIEALERALGRRVKLVLSPQMALLGLGVQDAPRVDVFESWGGAAGTAVRHQLVHGQPSAPGAPAPLDTADHARIVLPVDPDHPREGELSPRDWCVAAACAADAGARRFAPMVGPPARGVKRWAPAAAAAAVAMALLLAAGPTQSQRLSAATNALRAERDALQSEFERAQALHLEAERLARLVREGVAAPTSSWVAIPPALIEVRRAMGDAGFLHRLQIGEDAMTFRGDAPSAAIVLERIEESELFERASFLAPVSPSSAGGGLETFEIRALRVKEGADS